MYYKKNICFLCEDVDRPFDEGFKKLAVSLTTAVKRKERNIAVFGRNISSSVGLSYDANRFLLKFSLLSDIKGFKPDAIVYIPEASLTLGSFIRSKVVSQFTGCPIVLVGLQRREYGNLGKRLLKFLKPSLVVTQSRRSEDHYRALGMKAECVRSGIDIERFHPVNEKQRVVLKRKYGLPVDRKVLLHVGHIKESRGMRDIALMANSAHIFLVGSSSTVHDTDLKHGFANRDVTILDKYVESIEEVYQAADLYVFPTKDQKSAIEFPLSVLEAMACNLPVLTTRFGGLADYFEEDDGFKFYEDLDEGRLKAASLLRFTEASSPANATKVKNWSWNVIADDLLKVIDSI